ncbi:hypothetical protein CCACVL1_26542 [Corchorus capsularis]|uniref:Uncharacterized protein n=1 Tax=Corchorus capsularis TaxID=210143 RepID=A0A1R3GEJ5_COCAP|nr:hypothetical protein CCACVL1_26542 [Corchorus capsularis]
MWRGEVAAVEMKHWQLFIMRRAAANRWSAGHGCVRA